MGMINRHGLAELCIRKKDGSDVVVHQDNTSYFKQLEGYIDNREDIEKIGTRHCDQAGGSLG